MNRPSRPAGRRAAALAAGCLLGLILQGCGDFFFGPTPGGSAYRRRLYVNDQAANEALPADLVGKGIKFVMQPGRAYDFSIDGTDRAGDQLKVYYFEDNEARPFKTFSASKDGSREVFALASDLTSAQPFLAKLIAPEGTRAIPLLPHVSLRSPASLSSDTLHVRILFIRTLRNLPDTASKDAFAKSLFREMAKIYAPLGISLVGSYEIVEPLAPRLTYPFGNRYIALPGKRIVNNAHLYLVDSISIPDPKSGLAGEVLGFAPREVVDIDFHRESRVLLSARVRDPLSLAITATHELGHFFGLRHTVSTYHDILQDKDESNIEDGFEDTRFCGLTIAGPSETAALLQAPALDYCLRIAANPDADNSCDAGNGCDLLNLMHPVDCNSRNQIHLTAQQTAFLRKNLGLYRH